MKHLIALALLLPSMAFAGASFDGVWVTRPGSVQVTGKPDTFSLSGGMYECSSCAPPYKIKADGKDQPVATNGYRDHVAITVVSLTSVAMIAKKGGKLIFEGTMTVSADGSTLTGTFKNHVGSEVASGEYTEKRVGAAAAGAHAISGSWMQNSASNMSDSLSKVTLESTPNGMKFSWNGQWFDAKFDGKETPQVGDPGQTMVSLKKLSDTQIEETDRREGKVMDVITYTLAEDGKSLTLVDKDLAHEATTTYVYDKQAPAP